MGVAGEDWLSPLPPAGTLLLRADWPAYGITDAQLPIATPPLIQASGAATQFWPQH